MESGGFVNKFEGDAIMAFWGAPLASERQAAQAMGAALRCQEELLALNDDFARNGLPRLGMRIGINSGEVIVGNIGSRKRFEYTVIGDAVNLASRLEGINKQYGTAVICGALAGRMAAGEIALRRLDRVRVKGKQKPGRDLRGAGRKGNGRQQGSSGIISKRGCSFISRRFRRRPEDFFRIEPTILLRGSSPSAANGCWTIRPRNGTAAGRSRRNRSKTNE